MLDATNRAVTLAKRAEGMPTQDVWAVGDAPIAAPVAGEILVRVDYISMDPAMRGWIEPRPSYVTLVEIGGVMRAEGVGQILESRAAGFEVGDYVVGITGVQRYWTGIADPQWFAKADVQRFPPERYLGAAGVSGMTAYFGLLDIGKVQQDDTVVVTAAAGAVGSIVGQIARIKGARVIGIAGGPAKCAFLTEQLGFDACVDYKAGSIFRALRAATPRGIDVFFDSVGGEILDAGLGLIARGARVVLCGAISGYNDLRAMPAPRNYFNLVMQRARMEGFIAYDYADRYESARTELARWLDSGQLIAREQTERGIDRFPEVFPMLFQGQNIGKLVLDVRS